MHSDASTMVAIAHSIGGGDCPEPTIGTVDSVIGRLRASATASTTEPRDPFDRLHRVRTLIDWIDAELVAVARDMRSDCDDPECADFADRLRTVRIVLAIGGLDFADFLDFAMYGLDPNGEGSRRFMPAAS